jgi:flagellar biosynthesis protein FlhA
VPVAEGKIHAGMLLAMDFGGTTGVLSGLATQEPVFGRAATWIERSARPQAERLGYSIVEPVSVMATHLTEVVAGHADELLSRDATKHLVEELRKSSPAVVEELIPDPMKLVEVQQVLQMLLRERVSIRQLGPILEALGEATRRTKDPVLLCEYVRARLARVISAHYRDRQNRLEVVTIDPALEERIRAGVEPTEDGWTFRMSPDAVGAICQRIGDATASLVAANRAPVVLTSPQTRPALKQLTAAHLPRLVVLSYHEITRDTHLESVGLVDDL